MMSRLIFDNQPDPPQFDTVRADVACFVGLARLLPGAPLPSGLTGWMKYIGYPQEFVEGVTVIEQITNIPVPIANWGAFTSIFNDGSGGDGPGMDYLAATVRSFFAQGGKRCYVVRTGDPVTSTNTPADKSNRLKSLLPGSDYAPGQAGTWQGIGTLSLLQDVSFLAMPDLPVLCASEPVQAAGQVPLTSHRS